MFLFQLDEFIKIFSRLFCYFRVEVVENLMTC